MKVSYFSSLNALSYVRFLFNGECIIVSLMLNVIFLMYVNFMIFGFIGFLVLSVLTTNTPFVRFDP